MKYLTSFLFFFVLSAGLLGAPVKSAVAPSPEATPTPYLGCVGKGCESAECNVKLMNVVADYNGGPVPMDGVPFTLKGKLVKIAPSKGCGQRFDIKLSSSNGNGETTIQFPAGKDSVNWEIKKVVLRSANNAGGASCLAVEAVERGDWLAFVKGKKRDLASDSLLLETPLAACNIPKYCGGVNACGRYCTQIGDDGVARPMEGGCLCRYAPGTTECALACGSFDPAALVASAMGDAPKQANAGWPLAGYLLYKLAEEATTHARNGSDYFVRNSCEKVCSDAVLKPATEGTLGHLISALNVMKGRIGEKACKNLCKAVGEACGQSTCKIFSWLFETGCSSAFTETALNECLKAAQLAYLGQGCGSETLIK